MKSVAKKENFSTNLQFAFNKTLKNIRRISNILKTFEVRTLSNLNLNFVTFLTLSYLQVSRQTSITSDTDCARL